MTPVDARELCRGLDWLFLARRLVKAEEHAAKILSFLPIRVGK